MIKNIEDFKYEKINIGKGVSKAMLISSEVAPNFAMRKFKIEKSGYIPYHTNIVEHEQFVLKGRAKVVIADKEFVAKKGDVLFVPSMVAHSYETIGDEDYEFLCIVPNMEDETKLVDK